MKASISICTEIDVTLTPDDVSRLERDVLSCTARVRETEEKLERDIHLGIGPTTNLFIDLTSTPEDACFEDIKAYHITLSPDGYDLLRKNGATHDRTGGPSTVRVYVR